MFVTGLRYSPLMQTTGQPVSEDVQGLFDMMSKFVDSYLTRAEEIDSSELYPAPDIERTAIVQSMLSHIINYVKQTDYIDESVQELLDTMQENLFQL